MAEMGFWKLAEQAPEKLALVDPDGREWTRSELVAECNEIAHGLRALGIEKGDCVAVVLPNCAEFYALYLAVTQIGVFLTPINNHLTGPEIAYIAQDSGAKVFFGAEPFAEAANQVRGEAGEHQVDGAKVALGHAYGGGSQYFSMWIVGAEPR